MKKIHISNIISSVVLLILILFLVFKYCNNNKKVIENDASNKTQLYEDTLNFIRGQLSLQQQKTEAKEDAIYILEKQIDSLKSKHEITKQKIKPIIVDNNEDTGFVLAQNEYVNECEGCFDLLGKYKNENIQLKFERDNYDTLMRQQNSINEKRISDLNFENFKLRIKSSQTKKIDTTRKLKLSVAGMANDLFLPHAGGFGLIYEDKKFNEFGAHVLFSSKGNIYLLNIAKTISLRRKK